MNIRFTFFATLLILIRVSTFAQSPVVGGDRDAHGCIGSAGYAWSSIKKDCIRIFEEKIQLKELEPADGYSTQAALIFSKDRKKAEVFTRENPAGVILTRTGKAGNYIWKKGNLSLVQKKDYRLMKGKKVIYSGI